MGLDSAFFQGLAKKALGAAGAKVGGTLAGMVLDMMGVGGNSDVKAALARIDKELKAIDSKLTQLIDLEKWDNATRSFSAAVIAYQTDSANIAAILASSASDADKKTQIRTYVLDAQNNFAQYDKDLTALDDAIMGSPTAIIGSKAPPLLKTFVDTHWDDIHDDNPAKMVETLENAYSKLVFVQLMMTSLLVSYYTAKGDDLLAGAAHTRFAERTVAQYNTIVDALPELIAAQSIPNAALSIAFSGLDIDKQTIFRGPDQWGSGPNDKADRLDVESFYFRRAQTDQSWQLVRRGTRGGQWTYELVNYFFYSAQELSVPISTSPGAWPHKHLLIGGIMSAYSPYEFTLHCDKDRDHYRLKDAAGQVIGFDYFGQEGDKMMMRPEAATTKAKPWLLTVSGVQKVPQAETPTLSAWSKSFSANPHGEGRFTPGFHVRYRVIYVNRFGESAKSPWMRLGKDNSTEIPGHYVTNAMYYMPQILVGDGGNGAESYRLFRQFYGGKEEEIDFHQVGDPTKGEQVILDDQTS